MLCFGVIRKERRTRKFLLKVVSAKRTLHEDFISEFERGSFDSRGGSLYDRPHRPSDFYCGPNIGAGCHIFNSQERAAVSLRLQALHTSGQQYYKFYADDLNHVSWWLFIEFKVVLIFTSDTILGVFHFLVLHYRHRVKRIDERPRSFKTLQLQRRDRQYEFITLSNKTKKLA